MQKYILEKRESVGVGE